jgi:energy-converting hydrogenase Eha subunit A
MSMSGVAMVVRMIVRMAGMAVAVIVARVVRMPGHQPILPTRKPARPSGALIRHFDTVLAGMD